MAAHVIQSVCFYLCIYLGFDGVLHLGEESGGHAKHPWAHMYNHLTSTYLERTIIKPFNTAHPVERQPNHLRRSCLFSLYLFSSLYGSLCGVERSFSLRH